MSQQDKINNTMSSTSPSTPATREAASLLFVWSVFALVEGTIRMVTNSKPSMDVDYFDSQNRTVIPVAYLLAGGVAEVIFAIAGCYVAMYSLLFNKNDTKVTTNFLIMQTVLGWFVFTTFVLASPIFCFIYSEATEIFTKGQMQSLIVLGNMLGSICFCWALQGGQFLMGMRLLSAQRGDLVTSNATRAKVWSGNVVAAAFSTLFVGIMLSAEGFTSTTAPIGLPPHVVWRPMLSIFTGVVMLAYGITGWMASNDAKVNEYMPSMWVLTTTMMMLNFSWTFGIVPGLAPPIPGAAQHIGLIFSVTILPLFHAHRAHYPKVESSAADMPQAVTETDSQV